MNLVFVYGTLKRGQRNNYLLEEARLVGRFTTPEIYSMYEFDDYPAVCLDGIHAIEGEVYQITKQQFKMLDKLEWYPDFYQRIEISTRFGDAWMYFVTQDLCIDKTKIHGSWPEI